MPPRILVLSFSHLARDPRVWRQVRFLQPRYRVACAGFGPPPWPGVEHIPLEPGSGRPGPAQRLRRLAALKARRFERVYWSQPLVKTAWERLAGREFDLILANDIDAAPLAVRLAEESGAKVFVDAHEYKPRQKENQFRFRFFKAAYWDYLCRAYLPRVDAMTTVCRSLADEYERRYRIPCRVVTNAVFYEDLEPSPVGPERIRLVHHGAPSRARKLENMLALLDRLDDRFTLELMLTRSDPANLARLQRLAARRERVVMRPPAPMPDIAKAIHECDLGLILYKPVSFNLRYCLPNKFFEFVQARLGVALWPLPEMTRLAERYGFAAAAPAFSLQAMADALNALSADDVRRLKQRAHEAAAELCAERESETFLDIVRGLVGPGDAPVRNPSPP